MLPPQKKPKQSSDYRLHAMVIIGSILMGVALAACTPMASVKEKMTSDPVETPMASPTTNGSESGKVQGATTTSVDQQIDDIDRAMFAVDLNQAH